MTNQGRGRRPPVLVEDPRVHWSVSYPGLGETSIAGARRTGTASGAGSRSPTASGHPPQGFTSLGQRSPSHGWLDTAGPHRTRRERGRDRRSLSAARAVPDLGPGDGATLSIRVPTATRGLLTLSDVGVWCEDPFGLVALRITVAPPAHVIVYPAPAELSHRGRPAGAHPGGQARSATAAAAAADAVSGDDLSGLRPYAPGDRLTRLHWPSMARSGELVVREFVEPRAGSLSLLVDLRPSAHSGDSIEKTISGAAGFGMRRPGPWPHRRAVHEHGRARGDRAQRLGTPDHAASPGSSRSRHGSPRRRAQVGGPTDRGRGVGHGQRPGCRRRPRDHPLRGASSARCPTPFGAGPRRSSSHERSPQLVAIPGPTRPSHPTVSLLAVSLAAGLGTARLTEAPGAAHVVGPIVVTVLAGYLGATVATRLRVLGGRGAGRGRGRRRPRHHLGPAPVCHARRPAHRHHVANGRLEVRRRRHRHPLTSHPGAGHPRGRAVHRHRRGARRRADPLHLGTARAARLGRRGGARPDIRTVLLHGAAELADRPARGRRQLPGGCPRLRDRRRPRQDAPLAVAQHRRLLLGVAASGHEDRRRTPRPVGGVAGRRSFPWPPTRPWPR